MKPRRLASFWVIVGERFVEEPLSEEGWRCFSMILLVGIVRRGRVQYWLVEDGMQIEEELKLSLQLQP